jgi:hypothetical protein
MTDAADCGTLSNTAVADSSNDAPVQSSANIIVQCGRLIVDKVTVPSGDPTSFAFTGSFSFSLTDAANPFNSGSIAPGSYSVAETVPDGWVLTSATCSDGSDPSSISISGNETVTCTFTNSKLPTLIVRKVIQGGTETFSFVIAGNPTNPPNTNVDITPPADGEAQSPSQVVQLGDYSVTETPIPAGWLLTDASCVSDQGSFVTDNTGLPVVTFTARYGDDIICTFLDNQQGGTTRTQGFWSTHTVLTNTFWMGGTLPEGTAGNLENWVPVIDSEDAFLCKTPLVVPLDGVKITAIAAPGQNQVMGGFWSNIAKKSDNKKRSALDHARMQFLQQYLAAVLNVHAFGTPIGTTTLAQARAAYCGNNANAISAQKSLLAAYNEGGDTGEFTPGANATAKLSREQANIPFWDTTFR